jgi:Group II intron, maturase-specific domain
MSGTAGDTPGSQIARSRTVARYDIRHEEMRRVRPAAAAGPARGWPPDALLLACVPSARLPPPRRDRLRHDRRGTPAPGTEQSRARLSPARSSLTAIWPPRSFQPPVTQRHVEAELIYCVGGVLSPLLASTALPALDDHFAGQWQQQMKTPCQRQARRGQGNWKMIRYAGDFVVMVHGERQHAEAPRQEATGVPATLGLRLAAEKTRVVRIGEGFDLLSITIRRMRKRGTSKHYVCTRPSKKAIQAVKDKVTAKTYRSTLHQEPEVLIASISRTLTGWANYHRHGVAKAVFSTAGHHAWNRIMRWLRRKYDGGSGLGTPELRRRFCVPGTWTLAHNGVVFTGAATVPAVRYRYRGTPIPAPYPQPSAGPSG